MLRLSIYLNSAEFAENSYIFIQYSIRGSVFFVYILLMFYIAEFPEFFWLSLSQQILK